MKTTESVKDLKYYLSLPYTTVLKEDEDGDIVARIEELAGCVSHGSDEAEAIKNLKSMQAAWIETCIKSGRGVPEPELEEELPSGKWLQRVPRSLHQRLGRLAKREGVSLNALVTTMLSDAAASKAVGEIVMDRLATAFLCAGNPTNPQIRVLRGQGVDIWGANQLWRTAEITSPGIVQEAKRIMPLMVPATNTEEFNDNANEKEIHPFWSTISPTRSR